MPTIEDIMHQIGNEPNPADQIRRLAEIVSESTDAMSATTDRLEQKAAQLHNHEAVLATAETIGHMKPGTGFELLSDGTVNVVPTLEGLVRRPLSTTPIPGAVPVAGPDGTLGDWAIPPVLATQITPGIVKGSDTVTVDAEGALHAASGVTVISPPTVTVPAQVAIGYPFNIALAAGPVLLAGARVTGFEVSVNGGAPVTVPAVNGAATYSFTPEGEPDTLLSVSAVSVDSLGNMSKEQNVSTTQVTAHIAPPVLTSPVGDNVFLHNLTFTTSTFTSIGYADRHSSSRYRIRTLEGEEVYNSEETSDLVTHIIAKPPLEFGASYLCDALHVGAVLGPSDWSAPQTITISPYLHGQRVAGGIAIGRLDAGGAPWTQTENGPEKGLQYYIVVAPASCRGIGKRGDVPANYPLTAFDNNAKADAFGTYPERLRDKNTGAYNSSLVSTSGTAFAMARKVFENVILSLPNVQDMLYVVKNRSLIDSMDETVALNPNYALANWKGANVNAGSTAFAVSSTSGRDYYGALTVGYYSGTGTAPNSRDIYISSGVTSATSGVVPTARLYL